MERDAKNVEVSQNIHYGVSPAEGEFQSCPGGEAGICGDQPHSVEVMLAQNVSTLAVVQPGEEEPEGGPEYEEPPTIG